MFYGAYKKCRNTAWQFLLDMELSCLPIDVKDICKRLGFCVIKNSEVNVLEPNQRGLSMELDGVWRIIYDESESRVWVRFIVMHEIGHIVMGHDLHNGQYANSKVFVRKPTEETEADAFAMRVLMPACVLAGLHLHTAEEISSVCQVPYQFAKARADRMVVLYERNMFKASKLEQNVYSNFMEYIENYLK